MTSGNVKTTSKIINVRIYVEQAIKRMKVFHIMQNELLVTLLPIVDGIHASFFYKHHPYKHREPEIWPKIKHHLSTTLSLTFTFKYNFSIRLFVMWLLPMN